MPPLMVSVRVFSPSSSQKAWGLLFAVTVIMVKLALWWKGTSRAARLGISPLIMMSRNTGKLTFSLCR